MTNDIHALEGRELDAAVRRALGHEVYTGRQLIAEDILWRPQLPGLSYMWELAVDCPDKLFCVSDRELLAVRRSAGVDAGGAVSPLRDYHRSVDAILPLVQILSEQRYGDYLATRLATCDPYDSQWFAKIGNAFDGRNEGSATGPILAVALCRLLLLVKREEAKSDA